VATWRGWVTLQQVRECLEIFGGIFTQLCKVVEILVGHADSRGDFGQVNMGMQCVSSMLYLLYLCPDTAKSLQCIK